MSDTTEAELLADSILRAAGSGLRHYSMEKTRSEILAAAQRGINNARQVNRFECQGGGTMSDVKQPEWYVRGSMNRQDHFFVASNASPNIACCKDEAQAALIALAVNCHDDLVKALELMRSAWDYPDDTKRHREQRAKAWIASGAALARAKGDAQ